MASNGEAQVLPLGRQHWPKCGPRQNATWAQYHARCVPASQPAHASLAARLLVRTECMPIGAERRGGLKLASLFLAHALSRGNSPDLMELAVPLVFSLLITRWMAAEPK